MYLEGRRGIYTKAFGELRSRLECPFQRGVESLPLIVGLVEQLFAVSQVDALVCILLELRNDALVLLADSSLFRGPRSARSKFCQRIVSTDSVRIVSTPGSLISSG